MPLNDLGLFLVWLGWYVLHGHKWALEWWNLQ